MGPSPTLVFNLLRASVLLFHRKICYGKGLRMLRAMFPRPYCIHSEGSLDKNIHLLQPAREVGNVKTQSEQVLEAVCILISCHNLLKLLLKRSNK